MLETFYGQATDQATLINGSSRLGTLDGINFEALVDILGQPTNLNAVGADKTRAEWILSSPYGIATIYDYKQFDHPLEEVTHWSVGAHHRAAADYVVETLQGEY